MALDVPRRTSRPLAVAVVAIGVATAVGLAVLWPPLPAAPADDGQQLVDAVVVAVAEQPAPAAEVMGRPIRTYDVTMELLEGPEAGRTVTTEALLEGLPTLEVGQRVRAIGNVTDGWFVADFDRGWALWLLAGMFVAVVLLLGGWQGMRSLLGLGISLLLIGRFVVPAILAGSPPALVALVGAVAVMLVTLYLSHGWSTRSSVAVLGTTVALVLTVGLGLWFVDAAVITGFASEDAVMASLEVEALDMSGLVLAGLIVAALGVLDDVTVAQAATVYALHDTDSALGHLPLFRRAMAVGRDHVASTVNTLFLAYAGASLALLLLFPGSGRSFGDIVTSELVATEIVKLLVGSLGLIVAVPITTWLAAVTAVRRSDAEVRWSAATRGGHGH